MSRNPRTTKSQKMEEKEVSDESETSENSSSDEPKSPEKEPTNYEKQRQLRIAQNKGRMEAIGLRKIANSLMNLGGKRKSKRVVKNGKKDDDYEPNNDDDHDDDLEDEIGDSKCSSEELEEEKKKKQKKERANVTTSGLQKVEPPPRVSIPDSSLQLMGYCGEDIHLMFPKASDKKVKELVDCFPKGFNGFNRKQGESVLRRIAKLKAEYWRLRRSCVWYPEFREEKVEELPFPEGYNGFTLEESKEISGVLVTLENALSRLKNCLQSNMHEVRNRKLRSEKQATLQKQLDNTELMDEDDALNQAIALSLKDFGQTSGLQHVGLSQGSNDQAVTASTNEKRRKKKTFKSRVQLSEDDLVINFCQLDEVGKGSISLRDLQRMAASHDFIWTDKELAAMVNCFDSDRDGKLSLDDFRSIVLRCNMLQVPENP